MKNAKHEEHRAAADPGTDVATLEALAASADTGVLLALIGNPRSSTEALRRVAASPRIGVRRALLDSPRCPLITGVAEDRLAFEGIDIARFVDQHSKRDICRSLIGTGHRAETTLVFADPSLRVLDSLRTLRSLFTIHGGKRRDRKLNRHDYLRFLVDFNARGGQPEVLDLPMITLLTAIRLLGQERAVRIMTEESPERAKHSLRLLENVAGSQAGEEATQQQELLQRWLHRHEDWPLRLHDYLRRKVRRRNHRRRNRQPRALAQSRFITDIREFNRRTLDSGMRVHLPRTEHELETLGATMANCVGSENNVADAVEGRHTILHVHPLRNRRRGVTCQFDRDGRLLQARGFANGDADAALVAHGTRAMSILVLTSAQGADEPTALHGRHTR